MDWEGPFPAEATDEMVAVPETQCPLSSTDMQELLVTIPPLTPSEHFGIDVYERTLHLISHKL